MSLPYNKSVKNIHNLSIKYCYSGLGKLWYCYSTFKQLFSGNIAVSIYILNSRCVALHRWGKVSFLWIIYHIKTRRRMQVDFTERHIVLP